VWFDALLNYISGIGYLGDRKRFDSLWNVAQHVIGKDILRHHAIYWAIILLALGERPPQGIFAHGWWVVDGEKMSKSKGNVVDPMEMIDRYGAEPFKYYLLSAVQFGYDGTFSEKLFVEKYNADLANDLGNLLNRTLTMIEKYFHGVVPPRGEEAKDGDLRRCALEVPGALRAGLSDWDFSSALKALWGLVDRANKYIEEMAPWNYAKENNTGMLNAILYNLTQALGIIALGLHPFMPETARSIWTQLGMESEIKGIRFHEPGFARAWGLVPSGTHIKKAKPLFPRIEVS
jgi:methionyl-tRNA synthetase